MKYVSTREVAHAVSFRDALFQGLAPDGGLYIPTHFPSLSSEQLHHLADYSLPQLGQLLLQPFVNDIPAADLTILLQSALNFSIPLHHLEANLYLLEVFHGPTLAFKDVGARFMANTLAYYLTKEQQHMTILVATSGDTGSAIANAFFNMPAISVYILYPSKKVTFLQEQQMTTLGGNIHALEVQGTFDDCQRLVKLALLDETVRAKHLLSTANSINISRLLPQMIYHTYGLCELRQRGISLSPVLSVPSGNFGNLTSALYAKRLGIPLASFIAATNVNAIFPTYLATEQFIPKPSLHSLSNAMDVGNPSNFERIRAYYGDDIQAMRQEIKSFSISDAQTVNQIRETYERTGYILDPHTAVGVAAAKQAPLELANTPIIVTATAHPAKFPEVVKQAIGIEAETPERLQRALTRQKQATLIPAGYEQLQKLLLQ